MDLNQRNYVGWIPTVGGRLSFSVIGHTKHPSPTKFFNLPLHGKRYIFVSQKRELSDSSNAFPGLSRLLNKFKGISGDFIFVMYASANDRAININEPLTGRVMMYYHDSKNEVNNQLDFDFLRLKKSQYPKAFITDTLEPNLITLYKKHGVFFLDFKLERKGRITLMPPKDLFSRSILENTSKKINNSRIEKHIASELFFFIKDSCHIHQHHSPRTDTIIDLYECSNNSELAWVNETLRALYKRVLDYKRSCNKYLHHSALGVLSYARSFYEIYGKKYKAQCLYLNHDELEKSINIAYQKNISDSIEKRERQVRNLSLVMIVYGCISAFIALAAKGIPDSASIEYSSYILAIYEYIAKLPAILLAPLAILFRKRLIPFKSHRSDLRRLSIAIPKPISVLISLLLIGSLSLLVIWLLKFAMTTF